MPVAIRRRFTTVSGRVVHFLRAGEGPPAVLVHSSPTNAWYVAPQLRELGRRYTCFAFDTPGFGLSEALPGETLTVADLSNALAENMAAVRLPPCPVYGTHTGAAIALSLGARHPERVTGLVLDGVPIFSGAELAELFDGYFEPLVVDDRGGHYARAWTRFRDQYTWFPWTRKTPDRHNETDLGDAEALHGWVMNFFHAGATYKPAYRAAIWYGDQAVDDARALRCPAIFSATETDMLYPHLDRLPPLRPGQAVRRVGNDKTRLHALIAEGFGAHPATGTAPADSVGLATGPGVHPQFVDLPAGQVLLRHAGDPAAPAVLVLHDAPGSSLALAGAGGLVEQLAARHFVLAPDLPGSGGSDLSTVAAGTSLAAWADAVAAVCTRAGVEHFCVYGIGIGASLALAVAERHPARVSAVVLRGLALPTVDERAALRSRQAPPIVPQADGSHWYRTWLMLRDQQVYFPWFEPRASRLRRVAGDFDAMSLHERTFEVMKQHAGYHRLIEAAFEHDAAVALATLAAPLGVCHDPHVPFFAHDDRLRAARPAATDLPPAPAAHARAFGAFLAAGQAPAR